jgi:hypothetical protein
MAAAGFTPIGYSGTTVMAAGTLVWGAWPAHTAAPTPDELRARMAELGEPFVIDGCPYSNVGLKLAGDMTQIELHKAFAAANGGNGARVFFISGDLLSDIYEGKIAWDEFSGDVGDLGKAASKAPGAFGTTLKIVSFIALGVGVGLLTHGVILWLQNRKKDK